MSGPSQVRAWLFALVVFAAPAHAAADAPATVGIPAWRDRIQRAIATGLAHGPAPAARAPLALRSRPVPLSSVARPASPAPDSTPAPALLPDSVRAAVWNALLRQAASSGRRVVVCATYDRGTPLVTPVVRDSTARPRAAAR
jgi:hypothetical protein